MGVYVNLGQNSMDWFVRMLILYSDGLRIITGSSLRKGT